MLRSTILQTAEALVHAAAEHGVPNLFSPAWLEQFNHGPPSRITGMVGLRHLRELNREIAKRAEEPFTVTYRKRDKATGIEAAFICTTGAAQ